MSLDTEIVQIDDIESFIRAIRGQKVIIADDLARLYGVPTKRLNEQVKRNRKRFPEDFMFQLTRAEARELQRSRSQFATSTPDWLPCSGGRRTFRCGQISQTMKSVLQSLILPTNHTNHLETHWGAQAAGLSHRAARPMVFFATKSTKIHKGGKEQGTEGEGLGD